MKNYRYVFSNTLRIVKNKELRNANSIDLVDFSKSSNTIVHVFGVFSAEKNVIRIDTFRDVNGPACLFARARTLYARRLIVPRSC